MTNVSSDARRKKFDPVGRLVQDERQTPSRGQLPDDLAFLPPTRSDIYLELAKLEPATAEEIAGECGKSQSTVYRALNDLAGVGVVNKQPRVTRETIGQTKAPSEFTLVGEPPENPDEIWRGDGK